MSEDGITAPEGTPDGTGESRQKAAVTKIPVDPALKEAARLKICDAVRGNKFDPEKVSIHAFEGELLRFDAETILELRTKSIEKKVGGRATAPIAVDNVTALKEAIQREYEKVIGSKDMVRKIREVVLNRNDQGFALDDTIIPLNFWKKDFVIYEPCNVCRSKGNIQCGRCHGLGHEPCTQCQKKGLVPCSQCRGSQRVPGPGGQQITCPTCHGKGEQACPLCQRKGEVQCRVCKTKGTTQCHNCQGHGWSSHIHMVTMDIRTKFTYDREVVPEKVQELIERLGPKLSEHAKIEVSQEQEEQDEDKEDKKVSIHFIVDLPYGHIEFALGQETFYAFLFGTQAKLTYVSPFLEKIIANGNRKLKDAADTRGNVVKNLDMAGEYKTVRRAVLYTSRLSKAKAAKALSASAPLGLTKELIKTMILDSDRALKNVTRTARGTAFGIGLFAGAGWLGLYYFLPLRPSLTGLLGPDPALHAALDVAMVALCGGICALAVRFANKSALGKALRSLAAAEKREELEEKKIAEERAAAEKQQEAA